MRRRVLLDTNILLDMAMHERPEHAAALMLLDEMLYAELELVVCATSLKDVYYVLSKYAGEADARRFVGYVLDVASVDEAVCRQAQRSDEPDFEDGLVRACAEAERCDFIISRDAKAFSRSVVKSLDARAYLDRYCGAEEIGLP